MIYFKVFMIFAISLYMCCWCVLRNKNLWMWNTFAIVLMGFYLYDVLWITVLRREHLIEQVRILVPFQAYYKMIFTGWTGSGVYIAIALIGNTILFVPLGILFSQIIKCHNNIWIAFFIGLICSLLIECYQFSHFIGTFEMDDLIQNAWGSMLGCGIGNTMRSIQFKEKDNKRLLVNLLPLIFFILLIGGCSIISYSMERL